MPDLEDVDVADELVMVEEKSLMRVSVQTLYSTSPFKNYTYNHSYNDILITRCLLTNKITTDAAHASGSVIFPMQIGVSVQQQTYFALSMINMGGLVRTYELSHVLSLAFIIKGPC